MNLLDNAAKAQPRNIWIAVRHDSDSVELTISDDGSGVSPEIQSLIFEPFFTTRRGGEGTGLGLYLSRRIINENGGELSYCVRLGGGATFAVRLPALKAVA
jgi:signal transduction histidine kinase